MKIPLDTQYKNSPDARKDSCLGKSWRTGKYLCLILDSNGNVFIPSCILQKTHSTYGAPFRCPASMYGFEHGVHTFENNIWRKTRQKSDEKTTKNTKILQTLKTNKNSAMFNNYKRSSLKTPIFSVNSMYGYRNRRAWFHRIFTCEITNILDGAFAAVLHPWHWSHRTISYTGR